MFEGEFLSLETIYPTNTVRVPKPIKVSLSSIYLSTICLFEKDGKHQSWKQRSGLVYVGSSLTVQSPLFFVRKL